MSSQSTLAELYTAFFNRAPDADGLAYWAHELDVTGSTLLDIARNWVNSQPESAEKYPDDLSVDDFIETIYGNVLNRTADADGFTYWKDELQAGVITRDEFLIAILNGAKANTSTQGLADTALLNNKAAVGLAFANAGLNDTALASKVLTLVTADSDTLSSTLSLLKLIPVSANQQTPALLEAFSTTLSTVAALIASSPVQSHDLAIYLSIISNTFGSTASLTSLFSSIASVSQDALTNTHALDNPEALGNTAVVIATPAIGAPVPTFTMSEVGGVLHFSGNATGDIKIEIGEGHDFTATRGGIKSELQVTDGQSDVVLPTGVKVEVASGILHLSALNASSHDFYGLGNVVIGGSEGSQTLNIGTGQALYGFGVFNTSASNILSGGQGQDFINLNNSVAADRIKIGGVERSLFDAVENAETAISDRADLNNAIAQTAQLQDSRQDLYEKNSIASAALEHRWALEDSATVSANKATGFASALSSLDQARTAFDGEGLNEESAEGVAYKQAYDAVAAFDNTIPSYATVMQVYNSGWQYGPITHDLQIAYDASATQAENALSSDVSILGSMSQLHAEAQEANGAYGNDISVNGSDEDLQLHATAAQFSLQQDIQVRGNDTDLNFNLIVAQVNLAATFSDSTPTDYDIVTGFSLGADRLQFGNYTGKLEGGPLGEGGLIVDNNGIVTAQTGNLSIERILTAMGNSTKTVAFVAGNDSYVLKADGIAGATNADMVVKLVGVQLTDVDQVVYAPA